MNALTKALLGFLAAGMTLVLVSGCGPTMRDLPLPGSGVSGETITVSVQFDEALNLAQGAQVKVNGVNSGRVQSVSAKDFKAVAVLKVKKTAQMRAEATARLRYTTPLGELFVEVTNPDEGEVLRDGAALPAKNATTAPTVEDALASASLLVNGGGLNQLQTVTEQLNAAIGGREDTFRELLGRANTFLKEANATTGDIDRALEAMADLSRILKANESTINAAITDIRPAARVLRENTPQLTALLAKIVEFADTANNVVGRTRVDVLQLVKQVTPVLQEFLDVRDDLGPSFDDLVNASKLLNQAVPGDYANMRLELQMDKVVPPNLFGPGGGGSTGGNGNGTGGILGDLLGALGGGSSAEGSGGGSGGGLGGLLNGLLGGSGTPKTSTSPRSGSAPDLVSLLGGGR